MCFFGWAVSLSEENLMFKIEMTFISPSMHFWYFTESSAESGYSNPFSFCHWKVNNITAHTFVKIAVLQADYFIHRFDII